MIEIVYGPDGVGKSTYVAGQHELSPDLVVLHGTNFGSWFTRYPNQLEGIGVRPEDIPPDTDFEAKISFIGRAAHGLAQQYPVMVDGHPLHKTAINVRAGLTALAGLDPRMGMSALFETEIGEHFNQLLGTQALHRHVLVGPAADLASHATEAAEELQRRIHSRGKPSQWDPATVRDSLAQLQASLELEDELRSRKAHTARTLSVGLGDIS